METQFQPRYGAPRFRMPRGPGPGHSMSNVQSMDGKGMHMAFPTPRMGYNPAALSFNGKQIRKTVHRRTIDYNTTVLKYLENRIWQRDTPQDSKWILPDALYNCELVVPSAMRFNPMNCVTTKFIRQSTNKVRCPIFCVAWTPEGRRLITGASSGEFTLWNGLTFNFETILQAHDAAVRSMIWSHNDQWMLTADHAGFVKYWQSNMNNVQMYQAHKEAIRGTSFCPTDSKYVTCSDDGTVRIWDFVRCYEERVLRGHGADVKCVDWHPQKSLIVSGSKDAQQPMKLWDARTGQSLATVYAHKNTVMSVKWNANGNWFLTASRDHLIKLFDIRKMKSELQSFKGHKKEATTVAWHPVYEEFFTSGGSDGSIMFWLAGTDKEVGCMENAHEGFVWSLAWHPTGHILVSGSNDHSTKFWSRNKPGDNMKDRYNLNLLPSEDGMDVMDDSAMSHAANIPGMGIEEGMTEQQNRDEGIPGLDFSARDEGYEPEKRNRVAFAKPIPKSFEAAWEGRAKQPLLKAPDEPKDSHDQHSTIANNPSVGSGAESAMALHSEKQVEPRFKNMHMNSPRVPMGQPLRPPGPRTFGPLLGDRPPILTPPPRPPLLGGQPSQGAGTRLFVPRPPAAQPPQLGNQQRGGNTDGGGSFRDDDDSDTYYRRSDEFQDVDYRKIDQRQSASQRDGGRPQAQFQVRGPSGDDGLDTLQQTSGGRNQHDPFQKPGNAYTGPQLQHALPGQPPPGFQAGALSQQRGVGMGEGMTGSTGTFQSADMTSQSQDGDSSYQLKTSQPNNSHQNQAGPTSFNSNTFKSGGGPYGRGNGVSPYHPNQNSGSGQKRNWQDGPGGPLLGGPRAMGPPMPSHGSLGQHGRGHPRTYYSGPPRGGSRGGGPPYMARGGQ